MDINDIKKICIVGAGTMGYQIALCAAIAGFRASCMDMCAEALEKARAFTSQYMAERVAKGRLSKEQAENALNNLEFVETLEKACASADFVIEAASERIDLKKRIFAELDRLTPAHAVLSTNSSYIISSKLAGATGRPEKICNMHFFNPALSVKLVEVVKGPHTSDETAETAVAVAERMNKTVVLLEKEVYGFVVNRFVAAINKEAFFQAEMGIASPKDIDLALVNGMGYPMGPFRLMDLVGIDLAYFIAMERYQETMDAEDRPSPLLVEKYVKGEWGRKTGQGFYTYDVQA